MTFEGICLWVTSFCQKVRRCSRNLSQPLNLGFSECTLYVHLEHLKELKLIYSERDKSADDGSVQRSAGGSSWASWPQGVEDRGAHTRLLSSRFFFPAQFTNRSSENISHLQLLVIFAGSRLHLWPILFSQNSKQNNFIKAGKNSSTKQALS